MLKTTHEISWESAHTDAFNATKSALASPPVLSYFESGQPLRLETDASVENGLGFVLWQLQNSQWRLIQCGSRFLSDAETRYAFIELECLAVVWAVKKSLLYLSGKPIEVVTDHRPLIPIFNSYSLDQIENLHLQRLVLKLCQCQFHVMWQKGAGCVFPDAFSRHPVANPSDGDEYGEDLTTSSLSVFACVMEDSDGCLTNLHFHERRHQRLRGFVLNGFPSSLSCLPESLQMYWNLREHLSVDGDIIMKGSCIVVPSALRPQVFEDLHAAHQGLTRSKSWACQVVCWPGMTTDLDCLICARPVIFPCVIYDSHA